jgi:hypothetical protein
MGLGLDLDWAYEAVASAGYRFYKAGVFGVIVQGIAQPIHRFVQASVEIDEGIRGPQLFHQFVAGDQLAGAIEQHGENVKRLLLKIRGVPVGAEFAGAQVELELSKTHGRFGFGGNSHRALLQVNRVLIRATTIAGLVAAPEA